MIKKIVLLIILWVISNPRCMNALLDRGGKTYVGLTHFDRQRVQEGTVWHTHTTTDIGNPFGISVQITPFFNKAVRTEMLAKHLTHKELGSIVIASDRFNQKSDSVLPYHAIVHNSNASPTEYAARIELTPSWSTIGAHCGAFFDAHQVTPGLAFAAQMPLYYSSTSLTDAGASAIINAYFDGTYNQTTPIQAPLAYALHVHRRHTVCGPLQLSLRYNAIETESQYLTLYAGVGITLKRRPTLTELFNYHSSGYDHHKLIAGLEVAGTIFSYEDVAVELITQINYSFYLPGSENRIFGVFDDDGSVPVFSPYRLGAEKSVAGVFPLANVTHRLAQRQGLHELDAQVITEFSWQSWVLQLGYGVFGRQEERITVDDWMPETYAIPSPLYTTSAPFTNAISTGALDNTHTVIMNHRYLTTDMINAGPATNPAQLSFSLSGGTGYTFMFDKYALGAAIGITYEHGLTNATPSTFGGWCKMVLSL